MLTFKQTPDSAASLTNALRHFAYSCYGYKPQAQFLLATGFNGQYIDLFSGHYQLGSYRTYNTGLMRFHSPDSDSPFDGGGLNAYAYCSGDPINYHDPSGHGPVLSKKSFLPKKKTIMQRREAALKAINENPVLEAFQGIAENSVIKKELKTLSDTGKALNQFTDLMENKLISIDKQGQLKYKLMDDFESLRFQILEDEVMKNDKTLNSLLSAYPRANEPEPSLSSASLSPATKNKLTRTQKGN
ncbi:MULTISPECIES: RHS repeat-associated core domain-containing protein [Pseudomonas]|nr:MULTISPECIES: RHS repeat-associated core domain-containing protein [Pseudomonas]MBP2841118.1 RHS repeat-associated core domain-containing protein [Pseudomonas sp. PNP]PXZ45842.1 RHS repeat-associated core domain-containing protein [Pseudomonas sp. SMT-1]QDW57150.1 RHS repeat-associated core domain-containing protein [Pseudomonas sp. KBS0802]QXZ06649.1 RHS repeat-associated core domain-containing protein [Pseudomonas putida]UZA73372.1 RHS repeat-associated core domain-containing protein [Pse